MTYEFVNTLSHLESYLRRTIKPLEALLTSHKRLVIKDSAVSIFSLNVCHKHESRVNSYPQCRSVRVSSPNPFIVRRIYYL